MKKYLFLFYQKIDFSNALRSCALAPIGSGPYANVYKYYDEFYQCYFALKG
ncbi:hypothetical protein [Campylobacter coli]|uniref:hypothetical protein n=1 Tax=Campylobacter coli TaxID=195 RepID=UPI000ADA77A6|nr:hypothetical protein [Campylobacter coli]